MRPRQPHLGPRIGIVKASFDDHWDHDAGCYPPTGRMQGLQGKMVEVPGFEPCLHREAKLLSDADLLDG